MVGFGLREREGTGSVKTLLTCLVGHDVDGGLGWIACALLLSLVAAVVLFTTPPDCKVMPLPSRRANDLSRGQGFLSCGARQVSVRGKHPDLPAAFGKLCWAGVYFCPV